MNMKNKFDGYSVEEKVRMLHKMLVDDPLFDPSAYGEPTWNTEQLQKDFNVMGFLAPYVVVERKSDGVVGSLMFKHYPRVYFGFVPDQK